MHKRALARAGGDLRQSTVLDFGCGTGRLSDWLVRAGAQVDGVDVTAEMVDAAKARVPLGHFYVADGSKLPFADGRFDVVVTAYVLQYYVDGDGAIPRELARVLRDGGVLIAIEQVTQGGLGRGGTVSAYEQVLGAAGLAAAGHSSIRVSDSRIIELARRFPICSRLPGLPTLVTLEAAGHGDALRAGQYADVVFRAVKR